MHFFLNRYQVEKNELFRGQTYKLIEDIRFMFGKDNIVFWVKLSRDEYQKAKNKPLLKSVRLGEATAEFGLVMSIETYEVECFMFCSSRGARRRCSNISR